MSYIELTRENILHTIADAYYKHPVVEMFRREATLFASVTGQSEAITNVGDSYRQSRKTSRAIAEAVFNVIPFELKPLDLVAIWARRVEYFPRHRYEMAKIVPLVYAVQDISNPDLWKRFPGYYAQYTRFSPTFREDINGLRHIRGKVEEVRGYIDALHLAAYGCEKDVAEFERNEIPVVGDLVDAHANGLTLIWLELNELTKD